MKVFNKLFAVLLVFSLLVLTSLPVLAAESIANATVTGVQYTVEETGSAITFPITVKLGDTQLKEDTDYTVTYSNNTAVGQASLKVTGIGAYEGEQLIAFTITAKEEAAKTPAEDTTAEDTETEKEEEGEAEEVDEKDEETSKDSSVSKKKKDTEAEAKLDASDNASKASPKADTTEAANKESGSSNSTTKDSATHVSKPVVKKSPKTGDYSNGLLISFATLSVLLLAGGAYYIHLKRA